MSLWLEVIIGLVAVIAGVCLILGVGYLRRIVDVVEDVRVQVGQMKDDLEPTLVRVRRITARVDRVIERLGKLANLLGMGSEEDVNPAGKMHGSLLKSLFKGLFKSGRPE